MDIAGLLENYGARVPIEAKRLRLMYMGVIDAAVRSSAKQKTAGESLQQRQAQMARSLRDMREKYGLHSQLSDDQIRRIAREEISNDDDAQSACEVGGGLWEQATQSCV